MRYLFLLLPIFMTGTALADSPLTSTNFAEAYANEKMVMYVAIKGLDDKALDYLGDKKNDPVIKLAMINQLSWGNMDYVKQFETYLIEKRKVKVKVFDYLRELTGEDSAENKWTKKLTADDLMCWSYLQALSNYFEPALSRAGAEIGMQRDPESMAHAAVYCLISCQVVFDQSWCLIYKFGQEYFVECEFSKNKLLPEAVQIILDYLSLYQSDC